MSNEALPGWVREKQFQSLRDIRLRYTLDSFVVVPFVLLGCAAFTRDGLISDTAFLVMLLACVVYEAWCHLNLYALRPCGPIARENYRWQKYCFDNQCYLTPDQWRESRRKSHV